MINTRFEAYKVKREIKRSGKQYLFKRFELNAYKEPTEDLSDIGTLSALYHEQNSYIQTQGSEVRTRSKKIPMLLLDYEQLSAFELKVDDCVVINKKLFKVTGIVNIQQWSIIADISLEEMDYENEAEL